MKRTDEMIKSCHFDTEREYSESFDLAVFLCEQLETEVEELRDAIKEHKSLVASGDCRDEKLWEQVEND